MILTLARGHYCPKEHQQHLELAAFQSEDRRGLHPDRHDLDRRAPRRCRSSARRSAPSGPSSPTRDGSIQQDLDIQEYTDPDHDPMIPHTLVLKPGLVVHSIYNGSVVGGGGR